MNLTARRIVPLIVVAIFAAIDLSVRLGCPRLPPPEPLQIPWYFWYGAAWAQWSLVTVWCALSGKHPVPRTAVFVIAWLATVVLIDRLEFEVAVPRMLALQGLAIVLPLAAVVASGRELRCLPLKERPAERPWQFSITSALLASGVAAGIFGGVRLFSFLMRAWQERSPSAELRTWTGIVLYGVPLATVAVAAVWAVLPRGSALLRSFVVLLGALALGWQVGWRELEFFRQREIGLDKLADPVWREILGFALIVFTAQGITCLATLWCFRLVGWRLVRGEEPGRKNEDGKLLNTK